MLAGPLQSMNGQQCPLQNFTRCPAFDQQKAVWLDLQSLDIYLLPSEGNALAGQHWESFFLSWISKNSVVVKTFVLEYAHDRAVKLVDNHMHAYWLYTCVFVYSIYWLNSTLDFSISCSVQERLQCNSQPHTKIAAASSDNPLKPYQVLVPIVNCGHTNHLLLRKPFAMWHLRSSTVA